MVCQTEHLRRNALLLALAAFFAMPFEAVEAVEASGGPAEESELSRDRKTAEDLYRATSADAQTFERAITIPEVRKEVEGVFKRKLSDEQLQAMAV